MNSTFALLVHENWRGRVELPSRLTMQGPSSLNMPKEPVAPGPLWLVLGVSPEFVGFGGRLQKRITRSSIESPGLFPDHFGSRGTLDLVSGLWSSEV